MDTETDLFVQAFWVKCRDIIRPEFDEAVDALRGAGHEANVATLEFSPDEAGNAERGAGDGADQFVPTVPTPRLALHAIAATSSAQGLEVMRIGAAKHRVDTIWPQVDLAVVKHEHRD